MPRSPLLLLAPLAMLPLLAQADDCAFTATRSLDIDGAGLASLRLDTGAGDLDVVGVAGLARIEVRGKACSSEEEALAGIVLEQAREGSSVRVSTRIPDEGYSWRLFGSHYAYMDVEVRMPQALALALRDSSGDLDVSGVHGGLELTDSSGDITLRDLAGTVTLADSSGDIDLRGATGDVRVRSDSSGDIDLVDVRGNVEVTQDSSGDIDIRDVTGNAGVGSDSSGDIGFSKIGGDVEVGADGSGDIEASDVRGKLTVDRKAGGRDNIGYSRIGGAVSLPPEG